MHACFEPATDASFAVIAAGAVLLLLFGINLTPLLAALLFQQPRYFVMDSFEVSHLQSDCAACHAEISPYSVNSFPLCQLPSGLQIGF